MIKNILFFLDNNLFRFSANFNFFVELLIRNLVQLLHIHFMRVNFTVEIINNILPIFHERYVKNLNPK